MQQRSFTASFGYALSLKAIVLPTLLSAAFFCAPAAAEDPVYMFSYFTESIANGGDGLHLAYSLDGMDYHAVNGGAGIVTDTQSTPIMRDPYVTYADGAFRLVYTTNWGAGYGGVVTTHYGYSTSANLYNWTAPTYVDVASTIPNARQVWAPEIYYDSPNSKYVIYWTTTPGYGAYLTTYYTTTTDFTNYTTADVLYSRPSDICDADIAFDGTNYRIIYSNYGLKITTGGTDLYAGFPADSQLISGSSATEGPSSIKIGDKWIVYNDHMTTGVYGALVSTDDMATWSEATTQVAFPYGARHGNVFTVSASVAKTLLANTTNKVAEDEFVGDAGTADFKTASNWFAGAVPGSGQTPVIQGGHTVNLTSTPSGTFSGLQVGVTSNGTLNITNAAVSISSSWPNGLIIGGCTQGTGAIVQSGTSTVTLNGFASIGRYGTGSYTLQGGTLTASSDFNVGDIRGGHGYMYVQGGTINLHSMYVGSGYDNSSTSGCTGNAVGEVHQSGGTVNITGSGDVTIIGGRITAYGVGTYELSGGAFNAGSSRVTVGGAGIGTLIVSGTAQANLSSGLRIASGGTGAVHLDGGTISTSSVLGGGGTSAFHFNGGTLKASSSTTSFMTGLTTADVEDGGAVIDTNGYNVTIPQALTSVSPSGGLTKNGAGTLTFGAANTYSGPTTIAQGTLKLGLTPPPTASHRWSFNNSLVDSIGGSNATIVEVGPYDVTLSATQATVAGGTRASSDYIQLGSNLLPSTNSPVTIELWATQKTVQNWGRIFDFGLDSNENLFMSWTQGTNPNSDRVGWKDNGIETKSDNTNQPYTLNTEYHIVMVLNPVGNATAVTWYSTASGNANLGAAKGSFTTPDNTTLANLTDSADNLARSFYPADSTANASYNEVRFWDGALSSSILEILHDAGPNADLNSLNFGGSGSLPTTTTVNISGSGATLDLNNINQTIASLSGVAGSSVLLGTGTLTIGGNASTTFAGVISGSGGIIKNGTGRLTLAGTPTYTGDTLINDGELELKTGITSLSTISGLGDLIVGSAGTPTELTVSKIAVNMLTVASNSKIIIRAHGSARTMATSPVPEPSLWLLLLLAAAALYLKKEMN